MIELDKALELAIQYPVEAGTERVSLNECLGRVLAEDLFADRDAPPFHRATMDGYACRREDLPGPLEVLETVEAGKMPGVSLGKDQCCKIMTGAMVPEIASFSQNTWT